MTDYPETLDVRITEAHIAWGSHGVADCPAAMAFTAALRGLGVAVEYVSVYMWAIAFGADGGHLVTYDAPAEVQRWIRAYDEGMTAQPAAFTLTLAERQSA
jgi:hypothetical protein